MVVLSCRSAALACLALSLSLDGCSAPAAPGGSGPGESFGELTNPGESPKAMAVIDALQARHRAPQTVSFSQRAVSYSCDGGQPVETGVQTMQEWLRIPGWLRIDLSDPEPTSVVFHPEGRSLITAADRRDGDTGSTVMLLMLDVFAQDSATWLARTAAVGLDVSVVSQQEWEGRPVWVLGAGPGQLDRTQLWIDAEALLPARYLEVQRDAAGETVVLDGRASRYQDFDGVPFHTHFEFFQDGELRLIETYADIVVDGGIADEVFDLELIAGQLAALADSAASAPSRQP